MFAPEQLHDVEAGRALSPASATNGLTPSPDCVAAVKPSKPSSNSVKKQARKASQTNMRNWLRIDPNGEAVMMQADKWKLTHKLGVQGRDLRIMDPSLATSYPSAILCREKALVVSLEHIKVIITTDSVMVMNPEDENVPAFITELKMRLANPGGALTGRGSGSFSSALNELAEGRTPLVPVGSRAQGDDALDMPFELRALEVCLDAAASYFNRLTSDLEAAAYPALDALTNRVTPHNLERVRRVKSRLVRLTTRVENVREVLEGYLDDDQDMRDMNITAKEQHELQAQEEAGHGNSKQHSSSSSSSSSSIDSSVIEEEVAEVEMLLGAYFLNIDNTYNRLQTLNEYIQDTEDLVKLQVDQHRNQLIGIDLILTSFAAAVGMMTAVSGFFGMNLDSGLQQVPMLFNLVAAITSGSAVLLFVLFVAWLWRRQLLIF